MMVRIRSGLDNMLLSRGMGLRNLALCNIFSTIFELVFIKVAVVCRDPPGTAGGVLFV